LIPPIRDLEEDYRYTLNLLPVKVIISDGSYG